MKKHSKVLVFFAVSKPISILYSADHGRAEMISVNKNVHQISIIYTPRNFNIQRFISSRQLYKDNSIASPVLYTLSTTEVELRVARQK